MKILCTVKRSIDPDLKVKLKADGELDMSNVDYILNYFDDLGVEEAIRLKEQGTATEVVVVSVGTTDAQKEIRTALAMGADRGILVEGERRRRAGHDVRREAARRGDRRSRPSSC